MNLAGRDYIFQKANGDAEWQLERLNKCEKFTNVFEWLIVYVNRGI